MSELLSLLFVANDSQNQNFDEAQKKIIERSEEDPVAFINELLQILQTPELTTTPMQVFMILAVITNCFKIASEIKKEEVGNSEEIIEQSMLYFSDENEQARLAAVNLFNVITETQILLIPNLNLINRLTELLSCEDVPSILSAAECLEKIAGKYVLGKETLLKIIEVLMGLLSNFGENYDVISHVIAMFTRISSYIFDFFEEGDAVSFIESIVSHLGDAKLKAVIYNFIYSIATENFAAICCHIPAIAEQTVADLTEETPDDVKLAAAFCWEGIFADETLLQEEVMADVVTTLAPALIVCMRHEIVGEPSLTDWEPYTAAFSTLRTILNKRNPGYAEILHPLLTEQIEAGYTEEADQVVSARCLLLLSEIASRFQEICENTLFYISQYLDNSQSVHVVYYTLTALSSLLSVTGSCKPYMELLELIPRFCTEEIIGNKALDCVNRIISKSDFTEFEIYNFLKDLLDQVPVQNVYLVLVCFASSRCSHVPEQWACDIMSFLFSRLDEIEDSNLADSICFCIKPILHRGIADAGALFETAYPILCRWYEAGVFQTMSTIAAFAFSSPECIVSYSEEFLNLVLGTLQSDNSEAWKEGANAWSFMYGKIDFGELAEDLCEQIFEKADPKAPMELQEIALHSFSYIFNMIKSDIEAAPISGVLSKYTDSVELGVLEIEDREKFIDIARVLLVLSCQMARGDALKVTAAVASAIFELIDMHDQLRDDFLKLVSIFDEKADCRFPDAIQISQKIHERFDPQEE